MADSRIPSSRLVLGTILALWTSLAAPPAWGVGAPANTAISNTAQVTFTDPAGAPSPSCTASFRVRIE